MEVGIGSTLLPGDPRLIDHIVSEVKSQGIFDQFRKECIADVDTKPAYQNLRTRVESSVNTFLCKQVWKPDMNKNQLRENLRKHIHDAAYLDMGVERIVDQVVNPKVYSVFTPQIEDVVYKFLGIERPKDRERNGTKSLKDLLPKDLDPVSPESDKNSLKDVSLESVDANLTSNMSRGDNSPPKDFSKIETNTQSSDYAHDKTGEDNNSSNRQLPDGSDNQLESYQKNSSNNVSTSNLNISGKSDEKIDEEEEDSPMFEPIDIMNFNESNDSHLSGISELTSHRSRSPDFSNEFSRDNLDFSNHDSQLSQVSSDSRLSIVTDFGSSNHASTPMPTMEVSKEESNKGKSFESSDPKSNKDNFKAIRDIELNKGNAKEIRNSFETIRSKDNSQEQRDSKASKATKSTPDSTDGTVKDNKNDCNDLKEKHKDIDKEKLSKEKGDAKESKAHKEREKDHRKRQTSHSGSKHDKTDKNSKDKYKDKSEKSRDGSEKCKEYSDKSREAEKPREDKKDSDKKDSAGKDLKDIYKEKIRELREKKELTEKEKLAKDPRESKSNKDSRDKKDSSRDRKESKTSTSKSSSRHDDKSNKNDEKSASKNDKSMSSKSSGKGVESKDSKNDSKDKAKREDKRQSKDNKESRSKSYGSSQKNNFMEKGEKSDAKKDVKNDYQSKESERSDRSDAKRDNKMETQKSELKKDLKSESQAKEHERNDKSDAKKDSKTDSQSKDKKKKADKKNKVKDDHSSLRKNPNDRRSTDRDGSNGSSSRSSQKSNSSSIANSGKTDSTNLTKESSGTSNSSSETSDNIDVSPSDEINLVNESKFKDMENTNRVKPLRIKITNENESEPDYYIESELTPRRVNLGQTELSLPLKKRPLQGDSGAPNPNDFKVKKPKFAKNFQEAKRLMKIRKKLEKQRLQQYEAAKEKFQIANNQDSHNSNLSPVTDNDEKTAMLPDEERVQIIEVTDDEYEEPYPDLSMKEINISLERQSLMSLTNPLVLNPQGNAKKIFEKRSTLSAMEESIRESLEDMISDRKLLESKTPVEDKDESAACVNTARYNALATMVREIVDAPKNCEKLLPLGAAITSLKNGNCVKAKVPPNDTSETTKSPEVSIDAAEKLDTKINLANVEENEKTSEVKIADTSENIDSAGGLADIVTATIHEEKRKGDSDLVSSAPDGSVISSSGLQNVGKETRDESFLSLDDKRNCLYFEADDERALKFSKFLQSLEVEISEDKISEKNPSEYLEKIIESLGGQIVSSLPKTMAPPSMTKRKHSTSPLTDILLNNTNNNNNQHEIKESTPEEESNTNKKRKLGRLKKPRAIANVCAVQNLPNGENFVMPLSPESDVSASSEKNLQHLLKEDKSRQRSSQRYSSDDLYKPRPFFSSSSRRSRRSNQA